MVLLKDHNVLSLCICICILYNYIYIYKERNTSEKHDHELVECPMHFSSGNRRRLRTDSSNGCKTPVDDELRDYIIYI